MKPAAMKTDTLTAIVEHPRLHPVPVFNDNYVWALRADDGRRCLLVDPGDAAPVAAWLAREQLELTAILVTHHHADHIGGIVALKRPGVRVYGPRHETIPALDQALGDGDRLRLDGFAGEFRVLDVPGHTAGHIAFLGRLDETGGEPARPLLFCGDTLFSGGCGRLFEGTAAELHDSLQRLAALPDDTLVCCTHEYTLGNLRFAAAVEPGNADVAACAAWARRQRDAGQPTLPGDLARERRINPFLRVDRATVRESVTRHDGPVHDAPIDVFTALRRWKDVFR